MEDRWTAAAPARLPEWHSTAQAAQSAATRLPAELLQHIALYQGHGRAAQVPGKQLGPPRANMHTRMIHLTCRDPSVLHVCRAWRDALYGGFSRLVYADCRLESSAAPLAFLNPVSTKEVWLRFDGALLFGSWVVEWARKVLAHGFRELSVGSLVVVIVGRAGRTTTDTEDARCRELVGVCLRALGPRRIHFYGPSSAWGLSDYGEADAGDKFARIYGHMAVAALSLVPTMPVPLLSSIDTEGIGHVSMRQLVAHNAHSLLYLRIWRIGPNQLRSLVFGTAGSVVFGRLRELMLALDTNDARLAEYSIAAAHFPSLEALHVLLPDNGASTRRETSLSIHEHNFLTDLFFCGPIQLRQLSFPLAWDTVELLTPQLLASVQHLTLSEVSMEGEHVLDDDESGQMLSKTLGLRHVRTACLNNCALSVALPAQLECTALQRLVIPHYSLEFGQASELLRQLPKLVLLHCQLVVGSETATAVDQHSHVAGEVSIGSRYHSSTSLQVLAASLRCGERPEAVRRLANLVSAQPQLRRLFMPSSQASLLSEFTRNCRPRHPLHISSLIADSLHIYDIDRYPVF